MEKVIELRIKEGKAPVDFALQLGAILEHAYGISPEDVLIEEIETN